jgi:hypothetical protein
VLRRREDPSLLLSLAEVVHGPATRIEALATRGGMYSYGTLPEVEDLFQRQARELDRNKREEPLHQIQRLFQTLIPSYPCSAPHEELKLKSR